MSVERSTDVSAGVGTGAGNGVGEGAGDGVGDEGAGAGVPDSPAARLQALFEGHRLTPTQRRIAHSMVRKAADVPFLSSVELA